VSATETRSSSRLVTIPDKLNLGTDVTRDDSEETSSSKTSLSCSKSQLRRLKKKQAHATISRKLDEALERCRLLEAHLLTEPLESPARVAMPKDPKTSSDVMTMTDQVKSQAKRKPIIVWTRVDRKRTNISSNVKHKLSKPPTPSMNKRSNVKYQSNKQASSSVRSKVVANQATSSVATVTIVPMQTRRKKPSSIETVKTTERKQSIVPNKTAITNSKAAEWRRRAYHIRRKAKLRPSRATLRRYHRRKQREPSSLLVSPANPQSRQEDSLAEQQSKEGADTSVSAPGRS
jgi:hypothetical protein